MIGAAVSEAESVLAAFRAFAPSPLSDRHTALEATAKDAAFPGAILAWPRGNKVTIYYAVANTAAEWRRLRPLLLSFAGPTLTNFGGLPYHPEVYQPHERILVDAGLAAVARLVPSPETADSAERALGRLVTMVARTPPSTEPLPEPTSRLLARIRDHLNALAIDDAFAVLQRCRLEHRLDALNLRFLEIEIRAAARDWPAIAAMPAFESLVQARRPAAVTAALLESLYWTTFGDQAYDVGVYAAVVRPMARDLIRLPASALLEQGAWRLYAMEALATDPSGPLAKAALASGADLGDLATALVPGLVESAIVHVYTENAEPTVLAAQAVAEADLTGSLSAYDQANALLQALPHPDRESLLRSYVVRRALSNLDQEFGQDDLPTNWPHWLSAISRPAFTSAATIARRGSEEWSTVDELGDPATASGLADCLRGASDEPPALDRLLEALPHFVAWLQKDPEFPRLSGQVVYEAALERIMLSGRFAPLMLDSAGVLARALLSGGLLATDYRRLLLDLLEYSGESAGLRTTYWLIDLVEETIAAPAPDQAAREQFWQGAVSRLVPIAHQLSPLQRRSLIGVANTLGWTATLPTELVNASVDAANETKLAASLAGKLIGIYTLTESAGAQSAAILMELEATLQVRVNSEHGGSPSLRALAENADLFVIVAASATHAATDFIRSRRGGRPVVYAAGRGAASILRAVEEWVRGS